MRVLEALVGETRYDPDFGQVEARVSLVVKDGTGRVPRRVQVLTSQPVLGEIPLNDRLVADAIRLARHLHKPRLTARTAPEVVAFPAPQPLENKGCAQEPPRAA